MPVRTPTRTLMALRDGQRVSFPSGVPVDLTDDEIAGLETGSPGVLAPLAADHKAPGADEDDDDDATDDADDDAAALAAVRARLKGNVSRGKGRPNRAGKSTDAEGL